MLSKFNQIVETNPADGTKVFPAIISIYDHHTHVMVWSQMIFESFSIKCAFKFYLWNIEHRPHKNMEFLLPFSIRWFGHFFWSHSLNEGTVVVHPQRSSKYYGPFHRGEDIWIFNKRNIFLLYPHDIVTTRNLREISSTQQTKSHSSNLTMVNEWDSPWNWELERNFVIYGGITRIACFLLHISWVEFYSFN